MAIAAVGFLTGRIDLLFVVLFLLGCQASLFGPVKYSILPQLLACRRAGRRQRAGRDRDLPGDPARHHRRRRADRGGRRRSAGGSAVAVLALAVAGFVSSLFVPRTEAENPVAADRSESAPSDARDLRGHPAEPHGVSLRARRLVVLVLRRRDPRAAADLHQGRCCTPTSTCITFFLALFCAGIAVGSLLCERLSERKLELGSGAAGLDRHERVRARPLPRRRAGGRRRRRPASCSGWAASCACRGAGASSPT